ncbi:MAG: NAD(P)-dependent oxidoreductase [Alphaproteobacteria bacterium]|nr:NAD(P)-dependent oxidoreductase [Alphaproteobacteria bacterium]MBU0796426.1 NAD(P)-dependent oxidoreductase [Alphaproteobacteria bacterium]MBU0886777.1 NAD(P)-dependent oxidoreductase [Alphaproteobacteria bacterium]MBU1812610.1 NAD(P)-dependent oxidoreductase [Alphaproteobacteria bacterium]
MKVLLTGGSGFLGRHVLAALARHGIETVAVGRRKPEGASAFIEADLLAAADFAEIMRHAGATHLLHLAWYAEHGKYWTSPLNLRWVDATTRLVEAFCAAGGQKVVIAGTCAEYDWSHGVCLEDTTPLEPTTLYGAAKDSARRLAMAVCRQHGVPCAWGRVFLPFGPGESVQRLIPSLIEVFGGQRAPFGVNADACRDFLHASDVAEAFVTLLRADKGAGEGAVNIASGAPVKLADLVVMLAQMMGGDASIVLDLPGGRPGEPPLLAGDNTKLKALGWEMRTALHEGLQGMIDEARS